LSSSKGVVLVVDDNDANIAVYEKVIREVRGVEPKCFADSDDALTWLLAERPILAVVDYRMPGIDGFEFIKRMRLNHGCNSVPVVMLTGVDDEAVHARALALGVYEYMRKPVNKRRLQEVITFALRVRLIEGHDPARATP
jgi:two-component system response regulator RpfG